MRWVRTVRTAGLALLVGCALGLAACNDSDEQPDKVVATASEKELPKWLTTKDKIEPAVWLRGREVGHEVRPTDPEVERLRRGLVQGTQRFFEDPRMIANRTVQTGEMLAEAKVPEHYVDILTALIDVADVTNQKKLFGEMCQHYMIMRKTGHDRATSIVRLQEAYKSGTTAALPADPSPSKPKKSLN